MSLIPCLRSSIAAAIPPKPAPTIRTSSARLDGLLWTDRCGGHATPPPGTSDVLGSTLCRRAPRMSRAATRSACGSSRGSMWCARLGLVVVDLQAGVAQPLAASRAKLDRRSPGRCVPCAMNTRTPVRPARSGSQPSTVGMKPEKARIPRGRRARARRSRARSSSPCPSRSRRAPSARASIPSAATARRAARASARLAASKVSGSG